MKRPLPRIAALIASVAFVLAGCTSDPDPQSSASPSSSDVAASPSAEDIATVKAIKISGDPGALPQVTFDTPLTVTALTARADTPGTGDALVDGGVYHANLVVHDASSGKVLQETWTTNTPQTLTLSETGLPPELYRVLKGQNIGVRFVVVAPGQEGSPAQVVVGEVTAQVPTRAEGTPVPPQDGLPTVTLDENGKPSISIPPGFADPAETIVQPLIQGSGPAVTPGQMVTVQYTGWTTDGEQFDSSWDKEAPATLSLTGVIPAWTNGIPGQTVGSQIMIIAPTKDAYSVEQNPELGGKTLIFVIDILAAS